MSTNEVHNQNEKENEAVQGKEGCNGKLTKLVIKFNYGKLTKIVTKFTSAKLEHLIIDTNVPFAKLNQSGLSWPQFLFVHLLNSPY